MLSIITVHAPIDSSFLFLLQKVNFNKRRTKIISRCKSMLHLRKIIYILNWPLFFILWKFFISFTTIMTVLFFFFFRKISISFTSILVLFVFFFFRKILVPFTSLFWKLFFIFFDDILLTLLYITFSIYEVR